MKSSIKWIFVGYIFLLWLGGCNNMADVIEPTSSIPTGIISTSATPTLKLTSEPSPTKPEIVFNKISTANNNETKLNNQCLNIASSPPPSNSIIVLRSLKIVDGRETSDLVLVDVSEGQPRETILDTHITPNFAVSADRNLIAYEASNIKDGGIRQLNLIIANGNFQTQNSIPWDDTWSDILGWTKDQKIIISSPTLETISKTQVSYVLVDPSNGTQQVIHLDIPDFSDKSLYDLPFWDGWYGLLIDPTLELAVYPRQSNVNKEMYTYAVWDLSSNKTLFSLEKNFSAFLPSIDSPPLPNWSIDGSQFAFVGVHQDQDVLPIKFELFLVNRDDGIKQLTNLSSIGYVWPSFHSWSPDNSHIAFFVSPPQAGGFEDANVATVNTNTLEVTDLCLSIGFQGSIPIWSPNGTQFLVVDGYENDHQRILLVDVEKNIVFLVSEDAEPVGWMVKP